ncbi:M15 family metallopeptidase [Dysgonomonas alginatilytica]|uniref:M15 family metallopeptidase n=1 Tax=Dysgonomonas alginatilytica TaxID=1605892 RepID=UPI001FEAF324|nr:M15 family metallopeptidase [Dysgonomonas alginatilytica]
MRIQLLMIMIPLLVFLLSCQNKADIVRSEVLVADSVQSVAITVEEEQTLPESSMALYLEEQGLINIHSLDSTIRIDLKYATTDNFTKEILYDDLTDAFLHPVAAQKLMKAQQLLKGYNSDLSLLIYDAARPMSVQTKMYKVVENTPYRAYVADPTKTGMHNYGMAVDLTICNSDGVALDMGTPFDFFGKAAGINQEEQLLKEGLLTREQIDNRKLLRKVMTEAGFITIRGEWWHFNAVSRGEAKNTAKLLD